MRLIFVNRFSSPDHSATSQMLADLAVGLSERGREVYVIASRQRYDDAGASLPPREVVRGVNTHRVWTAGFGRQKLLLRAIDYFTFYLTAAWRLMRLARRGDVVIVMTDPPLFSVIAAPIVRLRRCRMVNWLHDVFPEAAAAFGVGGRSGKIAFAALRVLRNRSLRGASANVVLGERMAGLLAATGTPSRQIAIIPNWSDSAVVHPVEPERNPLRSKWELDGKFVVGYSGNLGRAHERDAIVEAMTALHRGEGACAGGTDVVFLFIGGGAQLGPLRREAEIRTLTNYRIEDYQPTERLAESLSAPDVHIVSLKPAFEGLIVPSKLYGILAAGRPALFIGDSDGEVARVLRDADCGVTVAPGDGHGLARAILDLARDPERRRRMGERARSVFAQRYDKIIAVDAWAKLLTGLASPGLPER